MGQKLGPAHVDAQHIGALVVAPHGVEGAAQPGPAQQAEEEDHHHQGDHHPHLHIGRDVDAQLIGGAQARDIDAHILYR